MVNQRLVQKLQASGSQWQHFCYRLAGALVVLVFSILSIVSGGLFGFLGFVIGIIGAILGLLKK